MGVPEILWVKGLEVVVGAFDVLVEAMAGVMCGKDFRDNEVGIRETGTQIFCAHEDSFGGRLGSGFGSEKHVIVPDHQYDMCGLDSVTAAMIQAPENILCFIPADADVGGLQCGEVFVPRLSPLDGDAIADKEHIDGASELLYRCDVGGMKL